MTHVDRIIDPLRTTPVDAQHLRSMAGTLAVALASLIAACGEGGRAVRTMSRDSAGVTIVEADAVESSLEWSITRLARIEGTPTTPFYRFWSYNLAFRSDGGLYVVDSGEQVVHAFGPDGAWERTIGRPGQGPGEFSAPGAPAAAADTLIVHDFGARGLLKFTRTGEYIETSPAPPGMTGRFVYAPRMVYFARGIRQGTPIRQLRMAKDSGYSVIATESDTIIARNVVYDCGIGLSQPPLFAPELVWAGDGEHIAVNNGGAYSIALYRADSLVAIFRRNLPRIEATEELALRAVGDGEEIIVMGGPTCRIPPEEIVSKRGYNDVVAFVDKLVFDPAGYIWVRRSELTSGSGLIDVLHIRDGYLGTLPRDFPWPDAFGPEGRFASIERDSMGVQTIGYYRLTR